MPCARVPVKGEEADRVSDVVTCGEVLEDADQRAVVAREQFAQLGAHVCLFEDLRQVRLRSVRGDARQGTRSTGRGREVG